MRVVLCLSCVCACGVVVCRMYILCCVLCVICRVLHVVCCFVCAVYNALHVSFCFLCVDYFMTRVVSCCLPYTTCRDSVDIHRLHVTVLSCAIAMLPCRFFSRSAFFVTVRCLLFVV